MHAGKTMFTGPLNGLNIGDIRVGYLLETKYLGLE